MRTDYPRYPRDVREKQVVSRPARERRLAEFHLTAFPSVLNESKMPTAAEAPHPQREGKGAARVPSPHKMEERAVALMTTNQLTARMTEMAQEEARKLEASGGKRSLTAPNGCAKRHDASFDRSSTYRLDYCNKDVPGFHERVRVIPDYQKNWNDVDKANVQEANKFPYLTMPETLLKKRQTVYRHDYIPGAMKEEYRTLSHNTNPQELTSSYAYSAYTLDDPARVVKFDEVVASCSNPRCLLWKTHSPRDSLVGKKKEWESITEELQQLRELRRRQTSKSGGGSSMSQKTPETCLEPTKRTLLIPGMRGMGYRQVPKDDKDYIYLPRDHFCHQVVYDY